jgi:peptidoglycan/LPS O-acetylase OafA/YrhL
VGVTNFGLFALIYFFLLGIIIGEFSLRYSVNTLILLIILSVTSIFVLSKYIVHFGRIIELLLWLFFFFGLFLFFEKIELQYKYKYKLPRLFRIIGLSSYSLYACHYPIVCATWWFVSKHTDSYLLQLAGVGTIGIPLIALGTYITYRFVEKFSLEKAQSI